MEFENFRITSFLLETLGPLVLLGLVYGELYRIRRVLSRRPPTETFE